MKLPAALLNTKQLQVAESSKATQPAFAALHTAAHLARVLPLPPLLLCAFQ